MRASDTSPGHLHGPVQCLTHWCFVTWAAIMTSYTLIMHMLLAYLQHSQRRENAGCIQNSILAQLEAPHICARSLS